MHLMATTQHVNASIKKNERSAVTTSSGCINADTRGRWGRGFIHVLGLAHKRDKKRDRIKTGVALVDTRLRLG